ncbi:uncharacterized protein LOC131889766 [Tigriopus californicus]|uniref:uncharacterized protein LOC131889766 n=1 Tax=Tigriopus californicus TaxID=6832 RepID=UPI0027D9D8EC|nr:uncharacterized protein LOC131889766 [Tigriopus californicus]
MGRCHLALLVILSTSLPQISAFEVTAISPKSISVKEGKDLAIKCVVDDWWEWCTFKHSGRKCDFEWSNQARNVTVLDCQDFEGRFEFHGRYNNYECGIVLHGVEEADAGEWTCQLENYYRGRYRGYGYNSSAQMIVEVEIEAPVTTKSTITTTINTKTTEGALIPKGTWPHDRQAKDGSWSTAFGTRIDLLNDDTEVAAQSEAEGESQRNGGTFKKIHGMHCLFGLTMQIVLNFCIL